MPLIMIRHGQPEWRLPRRLSFAQFQKLSAGYAKAPLAKEGREAIAALAQTLPPALILSSDLPRARETAEILNKNQAVKLDPLFRELQSPRLSFASTGQNSSSIKALVIISLVVLATGNR